MPSWKTNQAWLITVFLGSCKWHTVNAHKISNKLIYGQIMNGIEENEGEWNKGDRTRTLFYYFPLPQEAPVLRK